MTSVSVVEGLLGPPGRICTVLSSLPWMTSEAAGARTVVLKRGGSLRRCVGCIEYLTI